MKMTELSFLTNLERKVDSEMKFDDHELPINKNAPEPNKSKDKTTVMVDKLDSNGKPIVENGVTLKETKEVDIQQIDMSHYVYTIENSTIFKSKNDNYIKNNVTKHYTNTNKNPYISILEDFGKKDGKTHSTFLKYSDFIHLRDIGVYPINRLMILRRFVGAPSYDLNDHTDKKKTIGGPISTVIGWVKADEDIFNMSFNEIWKTQSEWLHNLIAQIIHDQFGIDVRNIFPIPGWGQSFIFGFLHDLGWTDYNAMNLPIGDANLLRDGITRETETTGLASNISVKLETAYEIKYVNNIDTSIAYHNIIKNLLTMGTEDIKFLFKGGSTMNRLSNFFDNPNINNLISLAEEMINKMIDKLMAGINSVMAKVKKKSSGLQAKQDKEASDNYDRQQAYDKETESIKKQMDDNKAIMDANSKKPNEDTYKNAYKIYKEASTKLYKREKKEALAEGSIAGTKDNLLERFLNDQKTLELGQTILSKIKNVVNEILASTMARYKWPVRGAIAQATGMAITPWHLTIGNPSNPIISMNQIKVDNVEIRLGSELMFNDIPKYVYATITISNARPLGRQELLRFFGVRFKRDYSDSKYLEKYLEDVSGKTPVSNDETYKTVGKIESPLVGISLINNNQTNTGT